MLFIVASSSSNWTLFLKVVEDFFNECESHMSGQEYGVFESLLERLPTCCTEWMSANSLLVELTV